MERRLSAVMAADMVGYSRLMEADEIGTIERQKSHRSELIDPAFEVFHGRIVKEMGDGLLTEFPSVVDAVQCAIQIQRAMRDREADMPEDRRICYRMGINLGDIVIDGDDILGDGVNIAARLETMAPASGICISDLVWQNLRGALGDEFSFLGNENLKNIDRKIRIWQWPADARRTGSPGPGDQQKPVVHLERSIAICPLQVFPDDDSLKVFSQGFDDDMAGSLSRLGTLRVYSRESSDKSQEADFMIQTVLRIVPPRMRCNVQLVNNGNGQTLWSEKFDGSTDEVFDFQDRIIEQVASACEVELSEGLQASTWRREACDPRAYELFLTGRAAYKEYSRGGNARARSAYQGAIERSPSFYSAIVGLACTHIEDATFSWSTDPKKSLRSAKALIDNVLAMEPDHPTAHAERSHAFLQEGEYNGARLEVELAIALDPNNADAHAILAYCMNALGLPNDAIYAARLAIRLNPGAPEYYSMAMVDAMVVLERFDDALALCEQIISRRPDWIAARVWKALALAGIGREREGRRQIEEVLEVGPRFTVERWRQFQHGPDREIISAMADQLVELGLPRQAAT